MLRINIGIRIVGKLDILGDFLRLRDVEVIFFDVIVGLWSAGDSAIKTEVIIITLNVPHLHLAAFQVLDCNGRILFVLA